MVQDLIVGEDQQVRAAIVKVSDPQGNTRLLRRSVKHLYPIEVRNDTEESQTPNKEENTVTVYSSKIPESTESQRNRRPRREAAMKGELRHKESQHK